MSKHLHQDILKIHECFSPPEFWYILPCFKCFCIHFHYNHIQFRTNFDSISQQAVADSKLVINIKHLGMDTPDCIKLVL